MNDTLLRNEIHSMLKILKDELHLRFGKNEENLFKKHTFSDENKCKTAIDYLKAKAQSLTIESDIPIHHEIPTVSSSSALWKSFDGTVVNLIGGSNSSVAGIIEFDKYLNEPLISRNENPLVWWAERKNVYPRLYELAKGYFPKQNYSATASSVDVQLEIEASESLTGVTACCLLILHSIVEYVPFTRELYLLSYIVEKDKRYQFDCNIGKFKPRLR
ncbi:zinc finger BED domain-containing protein 1-like [Aphis craccivora]|uniref:Zinc finger BED domain-containing protein 1-like n=1 Tax=Aphis craccivora TaxID=307492 RepID=A0A6G0YEQ8_APHCR|nr:zinc finger BED domain-containing protein 1-like [Aphis craccivora]